MTQTIVVRSIITEKAMQSEGTYSFVVANDASKTQIKQLIQKMFSVHVVSVSTSLVKGKRKKSGARRQEKADAVWKKATITVKKGEKISFVESGEEEKGKKKKK